MYTSSSNSAYKNVFYTSNWRISQPYFDADMIRILTIVNLATWKKFQNNQSHRIE